VFSKAPETAYRRWHKIGWGLIISMTKRQHRKPPAFSTLVLLAAVAFCQNHPTATSPTSEVKGVVTDNGWTALLRDRFYSRSY
jgi:hypothetical protein